MTQVARTGVYLTNAHQFCDHDSATAMLPAAEEELRDIYPDLEISINDVNKLSEMEKYTTVMIMPFLSVLLYLRTYDIKVSGGYD
jgi:hypothetical protein